jgi:hypothetical protein
MAALYVINGMEARFVRLWRQDAAARHSKAMGIGDHPVLIYPK